MNCAVCGLFLPKVSKSHCNILQSETKAYRPQELKFNLGQLSMSNCLKVVYHLCLNQKHPGPTQGIFRLDIVDWLNENCERLGFRQEISFHAIVLFDQLKIDELEYKLRRSDIELIACACLFIAAKSGITDIKMKQSQDFAALISYQYRLELFDTKRPTVQQRQ